LIIKLIKNKMSVPTTRAKANLAQATSLSQFKTLVHQALGKLGDLSTQAKGQEEIRELMCD
jgi:predicted RNA-binding protein Jag